MEKRHENKVQFLWKEKGRSLLSISLGVETPFIWSFYQINNIYFPSVNLTPNSCTDKTFLIEVVCALMISNNNYADVRCFNRLSAL